jgi:hypothetical protein
MTRNGRRSRRNHRRPRRPAPERRPAASRAGFEVDLADEIPTDRAEARPVPAAVMVDFGVETRADGRTRVGFRMLGDSRLMSNPLTASLAAIALSAAILAGAPLGMLMPGPWNGIFVSALLALALIALVGFFVLAWRAQNEARPTPAALVQVAAGGAAARDPSARPAPGDPQPGDPQPGDPQPGDRQPEDPRLAVPGGPSGLAADTIGARDGTRNGRWQQARVADP